MLMHSDPGVYLASAVNNNMDASAFLKWEQFKRSIPSTSQNGGYDQDIPNWSSIKAFLEMMVNGIGEQEAWDASGNNVTDENMQHLIEEKAKVS